MTEKEKEIMQTDLMFITDFHNERFANGVEHGHKWIEKGFSVKTIAEMLVHEHPTFIEGVNAVIENEMPGIHFEYPHNVAIYENGECTEIVRRK